VAFSYLSKEPDMMLVNDQIQEKQKGRMFRFIRPPVLLILPAPAQVPAVLRAAPRRALGAALRAGYEQPLLGMTKPFPSDKEGEELRSTSSSLIPAS
jgi:hypothetical protein